MAMSKTAVQLIVIALCGAAIPVVLINNQRAKAARIKAAEAAAKKAAEAAPLAATPAPGATAAAAAAPKPGAGEVKLGPRDEKAIQLQKAGLAGAWGRDPFHSAGAATGPTAKAGTLTLKGIAYRPSGKSYAMVNEAILREGEEIEGNRVVTIERRQITLSRDGRDFILRLEEESP